jgi:hypothetical protein
MRQNRFTSAKVIMESSCQSIEYHAALNQVRNAVSVQYCVSTHPNWNFQFLTHECATFR